MRVGIFLPPRQASQIRSALGNRDVIRSVGSWDELEALIRNEPLSVVVFDPTADGTMNGMSACRLVRTYSTIPFIAYVPVDAPSMREIAVLGNEGLQDVVVYRSDDSPLRFRRTLERASSTPQVIRLIGELQPWLCKLPASLVNVLLDALRNPDKYASAEDVAEAGDLTLSAVYRSFRAAGLNSPKSFVLAARVFRGFLYLRDSEFTIRDASVKVGYAQPRIFARHTETVLGDCPSKLRHSLDDTEAIRLVVAWMSLSAKESRGDEAAAFSQP